jgi:nucleoside 2-deoxyribosyltransferase
MKVYLAGSDIFRPDVIEWAESARALCRRYGYEPLTPLDHDETEAPKIFQANIDLIRKAQIVVANLNPFRGTEPDSGTCFEMGYALALGKKICGYVCTLESLQSRVNRIEKTGCESAVDGAGMAIENFNLPLNLMLSVPVQIVEGGLETCLRALRGRLSAIEEPPAYQLMPVQAMGLPKDPVAKDAQEAAIRYLRWVEEGRISDQNSIATVADQYKVKAEAVHQWIDTWAGTSTATQVEYRPDDVTLRMKISGRQYRGRKFD